MAEDLHAIWQHCTRHGKHIASSEWAGCFFCLSIFAPAEITEWIDEPPGGDGRAHPPPGDTALCPRCGMDAVLPSAAIPIDRDLLERMAAVYFGGHFTPAMDQLPAG